MHSLRLSMLFTVACLLASCSLPGLGASPSPTVAPIILIATATPGSAQPPTPISTAVVPATQAPVTQPTPVDRPSATSSAPTGTPDLLPTASPSPAPTASPSASPSMLALRLSTTTLVAIFRGQITTWNDAKIQADNPGVRLPNLPITVIHRSDPSGTTRALTEYFVEVDSWWATNVGAAYRLGDAGSKDWPVGQGASGSSQLAKTVRSTVGAIGYVAPSYAMEQGLPIASLSNRAGSWLEPSSSTLRAAAASSTNKLDNRLRGFIVNAADENAYPLALYTWLMTCPASLTLEQAQALTDFLYWSLTDPQAIAIARQLGYEPLPSSVRLRAIAQLADMQVGGKEVFSVPADGQAFTPRSFTKTVNVSGSGATFPAPLYAALIQSYQQLVPSVALRYDAAGSTQGRSDLLQDGSVQFAGSEEAVIDNDSQISRAACKPAPLHTPMVIGAVGIIYNLPTEP